MGGLKNAVLRQQILTHLNDIDIISVNETHVDSTIENQPYLQGFKWYGHCRNFQHIRAKKCSSGVGIFVNDMLLKNYRVSVIDPSLDGILGLLFRYEISGFQFIVFSCYLPPEDSPSGRGNTAYFGTLLSQISFHNYVDCIFICTDTNCRTGGLRVYVDGVTQIWGREFISMTWKINMGNVSLTLCWNVKCV